jgi:hypothetical protein
MVGAYAMPAVLISLRRVTVPFQWREWVACAHFSSLVNIPLAYILQLLELYCHEYRVGSLLTFEHSDVVSGLMYCCIASISFWLFHSSSRSVVDYVGLCGSS